MTGRLPTGTFGVSIIGVGLDGEAAGGGAGVGLGDDEGLVASVCSLHLLPIVPDILFVHKQDIKCDGIFDAV